MWLIVLLLLLATDRLLCDALHGALHAGMKQDLWNRNDFLTEQRLWEGHDTHLWNLHVRQQLGCLRNHTDFLDERQLWDLGCLRYDLLMWNLHDQHNRDIDHVNSVLQLGNLYGLPNLPVHAALSLRHDKDVHDLVGELQHWDLKGFLNNLQEWGLDVVTWLIFSWMMRFSASSVLTSC